MSLLVIIRIVIGMAGILFLPGFLLTLIFFPIKKETNHEEQSESAKRSLDWLERALLAIALSASSVPLVLFFLSKLGMPINKTSIVMLVAMLIIIEIVFLLILKKKNRN